MILLEIYDAITEAPEILTSEFIDTLLKIVLPIAESDADNKAVTQAINNLYQDFPEVRDQIKKRHRKNFDDAEPQISPGYETLTNNYPDIKKLEASLKKRLEKTTTTPKPDAKN
jgi:uncharacterized coiled-coil DUF342 family protein